MATAILILKSILKWLWVNRKLVAILLIVGGLIWLGWHWKGQRAETHTLKTTIKAKEKQDDIRKAVGTLGDDAVDKQLRDNGWLRD